MNQNLVYCSIKGTNMDQNFVVELFEFHWHSFSVEEFILIVLYYSVLLLWIIEFVKKLDIHKMDWIFQKWPTITMYILKLYIIRCCQAFLAVKLPFKSHCLYAYSYFCGLKHSNPACFSCQLTKIYFWVPMQRYVSLIL